MFKTILAFIKAHTIATAITTTVVVSTVVATPIIINQVQKQPEQEVAQVQENIIDNSVVGNTTIEENTETPEENNVEENTTVPEEQPKEENKQEQNKNQGTTKPTTPTTSTSNTNTTKPTTNNNKTENKGTWVDYYFDDYSYVSINKTTQKVLPVHCWGNVVNFQEYSYSELKSLIIPEMRKQYQEWLERNIALDDKNWQEFGVPIENKIKEYEKELAKLNRCKEYVINSGEEYDLNKYISFEGSGSYAFDPGWIDSRINMTKDLIKNEQEKLKDEKDNRHTQENHIRNTMKTFEANVNKILSSL